MEKLWVEAKTDVQKSLPLAQALGISPILTALLVQRGITTYDQAFQFFRPQIETLHNPFLMKGMIEAVEAIRRAIDQHKRILLYGDYDVDGTTSVALVYRFFIGIYPRIEFYLPDREKEGYGVSMAGIRWAIGHDIGLVIALDCGINAVDEVSFARKMGIEFIICDHHLVPETLPPATAILNPKQSGCLYPFKFLSGCGIGFKLVQAFAASWDIPPSMPMDLIDLVAVSTACDLVELEGENRILAYHGLQKLQQKPLLGLDRLIESFASHKTPAERGREPISFRDLLFRLGPRINAAGRMGDARRVVCLMTTESASEADRISQELGQENDRRRTLEQSHYLEAVEQIDQKHRQGADHDRFIHSTVLSNPGWHKGVLGILAAKMVCYYHAPTVILTETDGILSGSARSVAGVDIYAALQACSHLLERFGGHAAAGGLSLKKEHLHRFEMEFDQAIQQLNPQKSTTPTLEYHAIVEFKDISPLFFKILSQFAPFGPGNPNPLFLSRKVRLLGPAKKVKGSHLKLVLDQADGHPMPAIGFGMGDISDLLSEATPYDICYGLEMNIFRGESTVQIQLKDIKRST